MLGTLQYILYLDGRRQCDAEEIEEEKKIGHDYSCSFIFFRMFITGLGPWTRTLSLSLATSLTTTWGLRRTMQRITVLCNASRLAGVVSGKAGRHIGFTGMHAARRAFSAAQDEALVNTSQASSGLIVDPFVSVKRKPSLFTSPLARISHIRKQTWKGVKSLYAGAIVKREFDIDPPVFVDEAEDIFIQLHQGYKAGNNKLLRELTTPELYQSLRAGLKGNWALTNTDNVPLEFYQINMQRRASLAQCRLYYPNYKQNKNVGFAQMTVLISSIQKRSDKFKLPPKLMNKSGGSAGDLGGVWKEEFDDNTGLPYYWHTGTRQVQWECPPAYIESLTQLYSAPDDYLKIQVERTDGTALDEDQNSAASAPSPPGSGTKKKKKKKKKKKRLRTTLDVEGEEDEGAILSRNEIALDNNHYNINNVLVFEKPFHIKNSEWKLMKM